MIGASTRLVAMIGSPIAQVKSPDNFNRHFKEKGVDRAMIAIDLDADQVADFVMTARGWNNLDGFVVTIPHKTAVASLIDDLSQRARFLGAVNVVRRHSDGRLSGDMTDGTGFIEAVRTHGFSVRGKSALLVGAGAAGSAIAQALAEAGLGEMTIQDLDTERAQHLAEKLGRTYPQCHALASSRIEPRAFDLIVNASPAGMRDGDPLPISMDLIERMPANGLAADVITSPEQTPFLKAAAVCGLCVQTGPEMAKAQMLLLGRTMGVMDDEAEHA
ncbi:MAG: shikimate dehydrogenase family protein [Allorhizobium sp.]